MSVQGRDVFEECCRRFRELSDEEVERPFKDQLRYYKKAHKSKKKKRPYYKEFLIESPVFSIAMIFWAPGGATRPHRHGGSEATIYILEGSLVQELFVIWEECYKNLQRIEYSDEEEISEDPRFVHRIGNNSSSDWAVSLHLFVPPLEKMEVFDFEKNKKWIVRGDEDTLGDPPESSLQIWLR